MNPHPPIAISTDDLVTMLASVPTQPVSIVTRTAARMRKRGNPFADRGIVHVADRLGWIGGKYESIVNRQRQREHVPTIRKPEPAPFRADSLWRGKGEHLPDNRHIIRHKDTRELYLAFFPTRVLGDLWLDRANDPVPVQELQPYLLQSSASERQKTEKPIDWRVIKLASLEILRMRKRVYLIGKAGSLSLLHAQSLARAA